MYACICMCALEGVRVCMHIYVEVGGCRQVSSSNSLYLDFLGRDLPVNWEFQLGRSARESLGPSSPHSSASAGVAGACLLHLAL